MSNSQRPGDWRTLAANIFEYHEEVLDRLACLNPSVDRDDLHDAFVKAILEIAAKPDKFDESRQTKIEDFLVGAAQRSLLGILRTSRRRKARDEKKATAVANEASAAREPVDVLADGELAQEARKVARNDEERNLLRLWELGHSDAEIAEQLAIKPEEAHVIRDRLTQRLRRLRRSLFDDKEP